ncbi:hypothetical protein GF312_04530 [Candidatus Poribacteria bacterium]|nr:hypothetical protein [Candidatus Poribacteria bacterium]
MGVLERIESILKANLNDLLDNTSNPERALSQLLSELQSELTDARRQMASTVREGKRLEMLYKENEQLAEKWQEKALLAVQYGKDELAREAILRKRSAAALTLEYKKECELHKQVVSSLKSALSALENKIQEVKRKRDLLIARKHRTSMNSLLQKKPISQQMETFARLKKKIMNLDAESEALAKMNSENQVLSKRKDEELENELAKLKEKMKVENS